MASSSPASGASSHIGGGGPGHSSHCSVSLTLLSPAVLNASSAVTGAVFPALPLCLISEAFTDERDFEDYLQQFNTAARLSG